MLHQVKWTDDATSRFWNNVDVLMEEHRESDKMSSVYIVMPAYNEEKNIEKVVRQWYQVLCNKDPNSKLVVADSGSTDNTHDILQKLQNELPQLTLISDTEKEHGPKLIALYRFAIKEGVDYIFQTDSDGQTDPIEFDEFWEKRKENDAVLGCRRVREDGKLRAFVERVVCFLLSIYFGVKVPDANAPFRLMKTELVRKYINRLPLKYNLPNIMLTTYFSYYHEKMTFIDISFKPRQAGKNSVNICKIVRIGWKALWDFRLFKKAM